MANPIDLATLFREQIGGRRNIIINGAMQVAQRGTSETGITTSGYYTADRFKLDFSSLGTWTMDQADVTDLPGFAHSIKLTCTGAKTSLDPGNFGLIATLFEGQDLQQLKKGTSAAGSFTISFYVKSNKTGTYVLEVGDHDNSYRHINKSFTINASGTWEYKTITFEGDTTGVLNNDNGVSFGIIFWLAAGSTYSGDPLQTSWDNYNGASRATGNVNLADQVNNYLEITGLQMELGETATPFEHRSYGEELALCQRYYQRYNSSSALSPMFSGVGVQGFGSNQDWVRVSIRPFGGLMRAVPALSVPTSTVLRGEGSSYSLDNTTPTSSPGEYGGGYSYNFNTASDVVLVNRIYYVTTATTGGAIELDAEL